MCCCGMELTRRRWLWSAALASVSAFVVGRFGTGAAAEPSAAALQLLREHISVDVHTHGAGTTGIFSRSAPTDDLARSMRAGRLAAICLAEVPDALLLAPNARGVLTALRKPAPGELYRVHLNRMQWVDQLVENHGVRRVLTVEELRAAHAAAEPAIVQDIEGLDFLEGQLDRIEEAYRRGVRVAQLVHYTPNEIGDFQTGDVRHRGLSGFGADVIRECNRLGLVVDVAHGTEDMVKQAAKVSTRPLLLSHTAIDGSRAMGGTPLASRQISRDHARAVADTGGAIGIWHFFRRLDWYIDGVKEMVDVVGVDHVCIGTDQQIAPGILQDYADFVRLVDIMLQRGFKPDEVAKLAGENYLRIFAASERTSK